MISDDQTLLSRLSLFPAISHGETQWHHRHVRKKNCCHVSSMTALFPATFFASQTFIFLVPVVISQCRGVAVVWRRRSDRWQRHAATTHQQFPNARGPELPTGAYILQQGEPKVEPSMPTGLMPTMYVGNDWGLQCTH